MCNGVQSAPDTGRSNVLNCLASDAGDTAEVPVNRQHGLVYMQRRWSHLGLHELGQGGLQLGHACIFVVVTTCLRAKCIGFTKAVKVHTEARVLCDSMQQRPAVQLRMITSTEIKIANPFAQPLQRKLH